MRLIILTIIITLSQTAYPATFNVSTTPELRAALNAAAVNGEDDTVILAGGTYKTTDDSGGRFFYFSSESNDLSLIGSDIETVFDGDNTDAIFEHLASGNAHTTFKKIIFKHSNGTAIKTDYTVDVIQSSFINNQGNLIQSESNINIDNSYFLGNSTEQNLIYNRIGIANTANSTFESNSSLTIFYCGNSNSYSCGITISSTKFENNDSAEIIKNGGYGNYIEVFDSNFQSQPQRGRNAINLSGGCSAYFKGANNVFENSNFYLQKNPLCSNYSNDRIYVINTLFINSSIYLSAENSHLINNVFIGDSYEISGNENSIVETSNNYIDPNKLTVLGFHANNIFSDVNTGFVDATANDYHLTLSSDLVDAGVDNITGLPLPATDKDGNTRISGGSVDLGPYEFDQSGIPDTDGDGFKDPSDNCTDISNADQLNTDGDPWGDACDDDDDNDGYTDDNDAFPVDSSEWVDTDGDQIGNNADEDDDGDGILDYADALPLTNNVAYADVDADGIVDSVDPDAGAATPFLIDTDDDGYPDSIDDFPQDASKAIDLKGDFDNDGYTNGEEVEYCTNPLDSSSQPTNSGLSPALLKAAIDSKSSE